MKTKQSHSSSAVHIAARSPISRRTLLVGIVAAPLLAAVVSACGDPDTEATPLDTGAPADTGLPAGASFDHPTGAADAVIRFGYEGGFVPAGFAFVNTPSLIVSGDGQVYVPGITTMQYPGPMLSPMSVRTITPGGIQMLLAAADEAGLLASPPDYSAEIGVADAANTVVTIRAGGQTYTHSAYALGFGTDAQGNPAAESTPARVALQGYVLLLQDLSTAVGAPQLGAESVFVPTEYRLQAMPAAPADLANVDPAPTVVEWPAASGLDLATAAECARVTAAAAGTVFADADSNTIFQQSEQLYRISAAGVLPGDPVC
jgi:hypothetical protein